jgi:hypothetical protein
MTLARQQEFLSAFTSKIADDPRMRAAWLEGSWGRGNPDRYSDLDIHLLLTEARLDEFKAEAESWLGDIKPLVLYNLMFNGRMINGLTYDGLRIDIWLHTEEPAKVYAARARVLYQENRAIELIESPPEKDAAATAGNLLRLTKEFWRCISLTPSVMGRRELITAFIGLGIETNIVADILISGYDMDRDTGMKNMNKFLPGTTQTDIESILAQLDFSPAGFVKATLNLAELVRHHGPIIAARHGYEYPQELESAALRYVAEEMKELNLAHVAT